MEDDDRITVLDPVRDLNMLLIAIDNHNIHLLEFYLQKGVKTTDILQGGTNGFPQFVPLFAAVIHGHNDIFSIFLDKLGDEIIPYLNQCLRLAVYHNHLYLTHKILKEILERRGPIDINMLNHLLTITDNERMIELLLEYGAEPSFIKKPINPEIKREFTLKYASPKSLVTLGQQYFRTKPIQEKIQLIEPSLLTNNDLLDIFEYYCTHDSTMDELDIKALDEIAKYIGLEDYSELCKYLYENFYKNI